MQTLKELTNFISHVQTVYPFYEVEYPRFGLVSSSKATKSFFLSFLLGFTIFPPDFSHKLKHIEIVLDGDRLDQSDNEYTFSIQNISQEFADMKEFKDKLSEYISSLPSDEPNFSQVVQIKIYGKSLPNIVFFDLPEIEMKRSNSDNQIYDANDEETQRRRCVKEFIQGQNNMILYILNEETPISETNFIEYIRKYDVDCLRSLLIFDKILKPDAPSNSTHFHDIQKSLQKEGLKPKFGFTLIKQHLNTVEVDNYQDEMHHQGNRLKGSGNNDRVWFKLKDIAQYSIRRVFPGLLDQLKATASTLQIQLKNVVDEAERRNAHVVVHGNNPIGEYTDRVYKEFRDEIMKHRIAKIEERPLKRTRAKTNIKKEKPSPSQNESIVQRKGSASSSNQTEIIETAPDFDGEIIYSPEETTYSHRIRKLLNHIYKQEENKYDIEHFRNVSEEEMEIIIQTAETKTIGSLIQSQGFQFLVSSKLRWAIRSTYEAMSNTYDLILQFMESLLDRYFLKLPIIQETLKEDFKNYFDQRRQDVVQVLNTFLNSQINYVYFNEPQMFLYALYEHGGKNKKQAGKEGSIELLMQQISDASEIYCDDVLQTLKRCIPKMIGQLYLEDIVAKAKTKIEEFIDIVGGKNPKARTLVDPFKERIDDLQRKLYAIQRSEQYIYQNSGHQIFVWIEGLNQNNNLGPMKEIAPRKRGMSFDESGGGGIEHNGDFHIMKKANQAHPQLGSAVRKKSLGAGERHNQNHPAQEPKKSIHEHHHIKSRQIVFEGSQVIQDYFIRNQRLQAFVLCKRNWFNVLKERSIDSLAESRIFASAQYGLPNDLRSYIWAALARVHQLQAKHKDVSYHELSSKESSWEYVIEKDVVRTLVDDPFFRHPEFKGGEKLNRLLKAYANFDPELGYTQGMNTVAAVILMVMSGYGADQRTWKRKIHSRTCERNAFWILVYIMIERQYRRCFIDNYPRLMETLEIFDKTLKDQIPQIVQHMKTYDVSIQAVFMHQFMTVAGQDSPHEFSIRMMDLFLVKGDLMIVHVLVRTLQVCQEEIFARKDESLFRYLKHDMIITAYNKCRNNLNKLFVLEGEV